MSFFTPIEVTPLPKRKQSRLHARISCQYQNNTSKPQVVCISNVEGRTFERTVLPFEDLLFETIPEAVLEVRSSALPTAVVLDRIPCVRLRAIASHTVWPSCLLKSEVSAKR